VFIYAGLSSVIVIYLMIACTTWSCRRLYSRCEYSYLSLIATLFSELTFTLAICRRLSVCLSVTIVRPTQAIEIFGNVSTPFGTFAVSDLSVKNFTELVPGTPSVGG